MNMKLALPTSQQLVWHDMEIGMFVHWSPCVYQETQGDNLSTPLSEINPYALDTDQWVDVACNLGAKYIIMVAKHVGGFCMWQTDTTPYSIKNTPWRDGNGDVMADLSVSCKKRGIKLGVYISPMDRYLGVKVGGKCINNDKQQEYNAIYRQQVTELLSRYGEMVEVWFDGSTGIEVGDLLEKYTPNAMIFQSRHATIRWVGNEHGKAPYPAWNSVTKEDAQSGVSTSRQSNPDGDTWIPMECDTTIRGLDWFWSTKNHKKLRSLKELMEVYYRSVGHGCVLLLNSNPDRTGLIPDEDAKRAKEFGDEIRRRFANPIADTAGSGNEVELTLEDKNMVDHIVVMEDISKGERIRTYIIEGYRDGKWRKLNTGTSIGHKRIIRIKPQLLTKVRLKVLGSAGQPQIRSLAAYYSAAETIVEEVEHGTCNLQGQAMLVGSWGQELVWDIKDNVELRVNLTYAIKEAGQYQLHLITSGAPVNIIGANLSFGDALCPDYVKVDGDKIDLFVPGVGESIEAIISIQVSKDFQGEVWLTSLNDK